MIRLLCWSCNIFTARARSSSYLRISDDDDDYDDDDDDDDVQDDDINSAIDNNVSNKCRCHHISDDGNEVESVGPNILPILHILVP